MSTIAANRSMMAADSLAVRNEDGDTYLVNKLHRARGAIIGVAGDFPDALAFVQWYAEGANVRDTPEWAEHFTALVLDDSGLYRYEGGCIPIPIIDSTAVIGSGSSIARAAMYLGKDPFEAVELACELNAFTGHPISYMSMDATEPERTV